MTHRGIRPKILVYRVVLVINREDKGFETAKEGLSNCYRLAQKLFEIRMRFFLDASAFDHEFTAKSDTASERVLALCTE